ncbi:MAG: DsbA family protein [Caulobacteraceae bacterium]
MSMSDLAVDRRLVVLGLIAPAFAGCSRAAGKASDVVPDDMTLGDPKAKVTVVEYASVGCPVCGQWSKEVWPAFKAKYIDTGKIHYVFREMLVGGSGEQVAAASGFLLARCQGRGKYFSTVDAIFHSQPALFDDPRGVLLNIAKSQGLSEDQFDACIRDDAALKALATRTQTNATTYNIEATPSFVVNGVALTPGYHALSDLDQAIASASRAKA